MDDRPDEAVESDERENQMGLRGAETHQLTTHRRVARALAHLSDAPAPPLRHARHPRARAAASPATASQEQPLWRTAPRCGGSSRAPRTLPAHLPAPAWRRSGAHSCPPSRSRVAASPQQAGRKSAIIACFHGVFTRHHRAVLHVQRRRWHAWFRQCNRRNPQVLLAGCSGAPEKSNRTSTPPDGVQRLSEVIS